MAIADKIIVMNEGQVEDAGSPESIYLKPKTVFAASFMGEANLLEGRVTSVVDDTISINTDLGQVNLGSACCVNNNVHTGDDVWVCFRPEHVLAPGLPDNTDGVSLGNVRITDQAFFGSHKRCQLMAGNGKMVIANLPQSVSIETETELPLRVQGSSIVVLRV